MTINAVNTASYTIRNYKNRELTVILEPYGEPVNLGFNDVLTVVFEVSNGTVQQPINIGDIQIDENQVLVGLNDFSTVFLNGAKLW